MTLVLDPPAPAAQSLRRARRAVSALFFVSGAGLGVWAGYIPLIKAQLALDEARLGLALLAMGVGAATAMPLAGVFVARFGAARSSVVAGLVYAAALGIPPLAPDFVTLAVAIFALGASFGSVSVAMNTRAGAIERAWGRPVLSSIHAFFSIGGMTGAAAAVGLIGSGLGPAFGMAAAGCALAVIVGLSMAGLLLDLGERIEPGSAFLRPSRAVIGLGVLTLCSFLCEGALMEWGAVFLRDAAGAPFAIAAGAYAASSAAMTAGRLFGDGFVARLGPQAALRLSGVVAACGLAAVILAPNLWIAFAGLVVTGLGFANVVPIVFAAASRMPGVAPAAALAMASTFGYGGGLLGPPAIGFLSDAFGLRIGFTPLLAAALLIALIGARALSQAARTVDMKRSSSAARLSD